MRKTLIQLLDIVLTLATGVSLLSAQSPWNGNPATDGAVSGDPTKLTNSGFALSRSLYGNGAPTTTCSSIYNDGAWYTDTSTTPKIIYQCGVVAGTYAWRQIGNYGSNGCLVGNTIANGCTGATTVAGAFTNIVAPGGTMTGPLTAPQFNGLLTGNVTGNVSGTAANVTGTVTTANGGTGATTAAGALANLGGAALAGAAFTGAISAPGFTLNGGTQWTSSSSANSQVVTCQPGGTGTQVCDASGAWISPGSGGGSVTNFLNGTWVSWLTPSVATSTTTPTLSVAATTGQTSHQVIGTCGTATTFGPCALVAGDIPAALSSTTSVNGTSIPSSATLAQTSQLPATLAAVSHKWINSYTSSTETFTQTQPASSDLSDQASIIRANIPFGYIGTPGASSNLGYYGPPTGETITVPSGCTNSVAYTLVAPTGSADVYTINKCTAGEGTCSSVGSVSIATSGTATFTCSSSFTIAGGQTINMTGPSSPTGTNPTFTIAGTHN